MARQLTKSTGAESGAESYLVAYVLVLAWMPFVGVSGVLGLFAALLALQLAVMAPGDRTMMWTACTSQKLGPTVMRNAMIGFAECVRPGGKPTDAHCLDMYHQPGWFTSLLFGSAALALLVVGPVLSAVRVCYPEHQEGVNKNDRLRLFLFFLRHPLAIQGEGPSNGDGLAAMNGLESMIYPITRRELVQGDGEAAYWKEEGRPRLRDMFHDKIFCHRFFESFGAQHPVLVAEVVNHKMTQVFVPPAKAPKELIWKARYSTMGLGVEKFDGFEGEGKEDWAPQGVPYVIESLLASTEYTAAAEWYRMSTLWAFGEPGPKPGYTWRTRNKPGDERIQTDIIGGAYCVTKKFTPFVGPKEGGVAVDPRKGETTPLDPRVERALSLAIALQLEMHKALGQELWSIGWDVMVEGDQPIFIEFNINNGFFACDHTVDELYQMVDFYTREFNARLPGQLLNFDAK